MILYCQSTEAIYPFPHVTTNGNRLLFREAEGFIRRTTNCPHQLLHAAWMGAIVMMDQ